MPTRIVIGGIDDVDGFIDLTGGNDAIAFGDIAGPQESPRGDEQLRSVRARRDGFAREHDSIREFLVCEPRGHTDMFAAVPLVPEDPAADLGLFFMDTDGYLDMCGHATIGAITALVDAGHIDAEQEAVDDSDGTIVVETPVGLVTTHLTIEDGRVVDVTFENVPSAFVETRRIHAGQYDDVDVDVVSAGNLCGLIDAADVGLDLAASPASHIADVGFHLRELVNESGDTTDPITGRELPVSLIEFTETGDVEQAPMMSSSSGTAGGSGGSVGGNVPNRTVVVFGDGTVDRSPCGTGTSARMTLLEHRGTLSAGTSFTHLGPTGESFSGRVLDAEDGVCRTAVTGNAYVTGYHTFVRADADPLDAFTLD